MPGTQLFFVYLLIMRHNKSGLFENTMLKETHTLPAHRYLVARACFSDKAIPIWQTETIIHCKDRPKEAAYKRYINWTRKENEIAVLTDYAYADFNIPKKFDIIFHLDNPNEFLKIDYQLTQCIHEAWFPVHEVGHGHKHLCVFTFDAGLPEILNTLQQVDGKHIPTFNPQKALGFCNAEDFEAIKRNIEQQKDELTIFIANSKSVFSRFILLHFLMFPALIAYFLTRIALNQDYKLNHWLFSIPFFVFVWNLLTEKYIKEVKFERHSNELLILEKPMIGRGKYHTLNYAALNYGIDNISNLVRRKITGSKTITLYKADKTFYVCKSSGFNEHQLLTIESKLAKIKNDSREIPC